MFLCLMTSLVKAQPYLYHNEWIDYNKTYYKFKVMGFGLDANSMPVRKGMVRIPYASLSAAGLGSALSEHFQLFRDGEEVAIYVSTPSGQLGSADYIEFYGEINNGKLDKELYRNPDFQLSDKWSLQTDTAAYFLTINTAALNKRIIQTNNNVGSNTLPATEYFMHTMGRYFRAGEVSNGFSATLGKNLYSSSYDRGEGWMSRTIKPATGGCGSGTLPQTFSDLNPYLAGPLMTVRTNTVGDGQNSRNVKISINGDSITTYQMDYINYVRVEEMVPVSKISTGIAVVTVENRSTYGCDQMRAALIEINYPRTFNMGNASMFEFPLPSSNVGHYIKLYNFNSGGSVPVLYDYTNNKRYVADLTITDTMQFVLDPSVEEYKLILTTQAGAYYKEGINLEQRNFTNFTQLANQGDYLIISNPLIYGSGATNYVEQYRLYRSSSDGGSFIAKTIDINELVDQFAWGIKKHPLSIKNFLRYARTTFAAPPKYAFLIGKGVIYSEYRANESNPLADQLNLIPTWGNPASDNLLAAEDFTAIPATPIGRLSAVTPQEVGDYLLKVQQHEAAQKDTTQTIAAKAWMKNVIQIAGANDLSLGNQLDGYLNNYKATISDTAFGANVINFSKTADPGGYPEAVNSFKNIYENGAGLITYFGHSSATSLDFNLDNPTNYNNPEKYPMFIANGCSAGNHFTFENNRFLSKSTISEKFVLSPQGGAIGYLASTHYGVINYLDLYTKDFYKALGNTQYNKGIGDVIKEAISSSLAITGLYDYFSRVHAEQYALHGDPAVKIHASALPDYDVEASQLTVSPSFISVADSSFTVKIKLYNLGRATTDPVNLKITRQKPNGEITNISTSVLAPIDYTDSITVSIPISGSLDKGTNRITATVDEADIVDELSELNNTAFVDVEISEDEIRPIYPYNYAIISNPIAKLSASTADPIFPSKVYAVELDTTTLFNSGFKIVKSDTSIGGVLTFDPGITYEDGKTYYWRVAPKSATDPHWRNASFTYKANAVSGFQQGHLYQNLQSQLTDLNIDSTDGKMSYTQKVHNLFVVNSIYPTSGTEDDHFSVSVDGSSIIESACAGSSVIVNVFDSLTFQPWQNLTNPFNAAPVCAAGREYNFEYKYTSAATRKNAMDFLDAVPNGSYVTVRLVLDQPYNSFAAQWKADTTLYGSNNSLYHRLKNYGFAQIDSFYFARTWAFVFRKGDNSFTPSYALSEGLYDRINLSVNCVTKNIQGYVSSPVFGPAKQWDSVVWKGYSMEANNDDATVDVIGIKPDGTETVLNTLTTAQQNFSIGNVSAAQYPTIRLRMSNRDSITATPYQLTSWAVIYDPAPEGALAPNLYYAIPDTVGAYSSNNPDPYLMKMGIAFKNVSITNFDSLSLKVVLYDSIGNRITYPQDKLRTLPAGDSININLMLDVAAISGWYNLYLEVNPDQAQPEQFRFNNFLYKRIFFDKGSILSVDKLEFNAYLNKAIVNTTWRTGDPANTATYEVQRKNNSGAYTTLGTVLATRSTTYAFDDAKPGLGKNYYRLKIVGINGNITYSPDKIITIAKSTGIAIYPNPVTNLLNVSLGNAERTATNLSIYNVYGQVMWRGKASNFIQVDMSNYPSGMYMLRVDESPQAIKIQKQ